MTPVDSPRFLTLRLIIAHCSWIRSSRTPLVALVKRSNGRALDRYLCSILIIIAIISVGIVVIVAAARREGKGKFANEIRTSGMDLLLNISRG